MKEDNVESFFVTGVIDEYLGKDTEDCDIIVDCLAPNIFFKHKGLLYKANYIHFSREGE